MCQLKMNKNIADEVVKLYLDLFLMLYVVE